MSDSNTSETLVIWISRGGGAHTRRGRRPAFTEICNRAAARVLCCYCADTRSHRTSIRTAPLGVLHLKRAGSPPANPPPNRIFHAQAGELSSNRRHPGPRRAHAPSHSIADRSTAALKLSITIRRGQPPKNSNARSKQSMTAFRSCVNVGTTQLNRL